MKLFHRLISSAIWTGVALAAPLHHWDFSQLKNGRVSDRGAAAQDAVVKGNVTADALGAMFTGDVGNSLVVEDFDATGLDGAFTFAFWIEPKTAAKVRVFGKPYSANPSWATPQPGFLANSSGLPSFAGWCGDGKEKAVVEGKEPLVANAWVHFAVTYDGRELLLYRDGALLAKAPAQPGHQVGKGPFYIGRIKEEERHFKGRMGSLTIEARAWSADEIRAAFQKEAPRYPKSDAAAGPMFPTEPLDYKNQPKSPWSKGFITPFHALKDYPRQANTVQMDRFGGTLDRTETATGFFRTQKIGDRWWLITPEGHPFIHKAVVAVGPNGGKTARENFPKNFTDNEDWANKTTEMLSGYGFNGTGAWSGVTDLAKAKKRLAVPLIKNYMADFARSKKLNEAAVGHSGYVKEAIPVFDPDFETFAAGYAQEELKSYAKDPWLFGVFSDNELQTPRLANYLELDPAVPAQAVNLKAAREWLDQQTGKKGSTKADITPALQAKWHAHVFARYYRIVSAAIHKALPNHLYLGSRLHAQADKENPFLWEAIGPHIDLISLNYYGDFTPDPDMVPMWTAKSGKPVIITEWYMKGDDVGFPNTTGAGWIVRTQRDRGLWYQHFVLHLLTMKNIVGWHWFKYMDNDPSDPSADPSNRDSNKGIVKTDWSIYTEPAELMKALNVEVYPLIKWLDRK